jgi:uncharacterized delta-60 repeat protein
MSWFFGMPSFRSQRRRPATKPSAPVRKIRPRLERLEDRLTPNAGDLDQTFGNGGLVTTDLNSGYDWAYAVAPQPDGKVVAAGRTGISGFDFAVVRYNSDGSLDTSFGSGGQVVTDLGSGDDYAQGVVIQPDGKIVVAGYTGTGLAHDFAVVRYNSDGTLDTSFGTGGQVVTDFGGNDTGAAVALQSDGKIVVAGSYDSSNSLSDADFALARYNADGTLDGTFGSGGKVVTNFNGSSNDVAHALALQADGKVVLGGESNGLFALARYNAAGTLDSTFAGGKVTSLFPYRTAAVRALAIQGDGMIVAAGDADGGYRGDDFALARYNANGTLDYHFGPNAGQLTADFGPADVATSVVVDPYGRIIVGGYSTDGSGYNFTLTRYLGSGFLDIGFGTGAGGVVTTDFDGSADQAYAMALQGDNLVVAGYAGNDFALARYQVLNTPPTPDAGGPYTVAEGGSVILDASGSTDPD